MTEIKTPGDDDGQQDQAENTSNAASQPGSLDEALKDSKTLISSLLQKFAMEKISARETAELEEFCKGLDLTGNPDNNPEVLKAFNAKLEGMGLRRNDIHNKSLVLTGDSKMSAETKMAAAESNRLLAKGIEPTEAYASNVKLYHFTCDEIGGKRVYRKTGLDKITAWFESMVRKQGDNGGGLLKSLFTASLRSKANMEEITANIERLGLNKYFKNDNGYIMEDIEDIRHGAVLDDLLRLQNEPGNQYLRNLDPQEGLRVAAKLVADIHAESGAGIGEILANDIYLQVKDGKITGARLAIPDMAYSKNVPVLEQQATDLLDLCFSAGTSGWQSASEEQGRQNIRTVVRNYGHKTVLEKLCALLNTGRPHYSSHNWARLGYDRIPDPPKAHERLRETIREEVLAEAVPLKR